MATDLLLTKLYPPSPSSHLVARPRLWKRLGEALAGPLTLVTAPAGFGKTTLLAEWASHSRQPVAWLSLDEYDNDPTRFWTYTIAAIQRLHPNLSRQALALLRAPQPSDQQLVLTRLINSIQRSSLDFTLVLDDCHCITNPQLHQGLSFLLDHLPARMHLVILSRDEPPLPWAPMLAHGRLTALRADDLRFTNEEAILFLRRALALDVPSEGLNSLVAQVEGWAAGLQLAAGSIHAAENATEVIQGFSGSHRLVQDYFTEQVINRLPENIQSFMLHTSVLDRMSAPLCDALTRCDGSQLALEHLERANLFVVPLDGEQRWYRYHHLFAQFLRHLAEPRLDVAELHRRASVWFEQNGLTSEAIEHALSAKDAARAASLIEPGAEQAMRRGQVSTVLRWLQALPAEIVRSRAGLCLWFGWTHAMTGDLTAAETYLQSLERLQKTDAARASLDAEARCQQAQARRYAGQVAVIRSTLALNTGRLTEALAYLRRALEALPEDDVRMRGLVAQNLGVIGLARVDVDTAERAILEACRASRADHHFFIQLASLEHLARLRILQGRLAEADKTSRQALALAGEHDMDRLGHGALLTLAQICYERNELDSALRHAQEALRLGQLAVAPASLCEGLIAAARIKQAQGDPAAADDFVAQARQAALQRDDAQTTSWVAGWQARLWLQQGRTESAAQWARQAALSAKGNLDGGREFEHLTWARVLLAQKQWPAAFELLAPLRRAAQASSRIHIRLEILVVMALAQHAAGHVSQALANLFQAVVLAEPSGYVRLFVDEGPALQNMLGRLRTSLAKPGSHLSAYVNKIDENFPRSSAGSPRLALLDPLTESEAQVLACIALGLSNRAVAQKLVVAQSTVEWHIKNIYSKMAVHSRTQAVAQARALKLLE